MSWLVSLVVAGSVAYGPVDAPMATSSLARPTLYSSALDLLESESRRIRSSERGITRLLADGVRRSKTFTDLVTRIHQTDVIVYVESSHHLAPDTVGRLLLQTVAGGQRYLRVQVRAMMQGDHIISVLAHELQHALEVAEDTSVIDEATLTELYRRIGHSSANLKGFDTDRARAAGLKVRDELIGSRSAV